MLELSQDIDIKCNVSIKSKFVYRVEQSTTFTYYINQSSDLDEIQVNFHNLASANTKYKLNETVIFTSIKPFSFI